VPLQNRVTPFGQLIATPARGTLMGNRGCLHDAERLADGRTKRTYTERLARLPAGAMVADADGKAYLLQDGALAHWTPAGYAARLRPPAETRLAVRSIVRALARGYPVGVHASAHGPGGAARAREG